MKRLLAVGQVDGVRALGALDQPVAQPDVGEGAADQHLVLAAPGAVRVELERADAVRLEPLAGRRPGRDRAGRRDVVGRHRVAEHRQHPGADDVADGRRVEGHRRRRTAAWRCTSTRPARHSGRPTGSAARASARRPRRRSRRSPGTAPGRSSSAMTERISSGSGQMSARKTGRPSDPVPERLRGQVDVDPAGQREGHDERRRGEVAGAREGMDATLEVAVARQDGRDHQVVRLDRRRDGVVERAGVADAGRAAVAGQVEPERLERGHQPGRLEIAGDGPRAGRQRRLDGRLDAQSASDGIPRQQAGADHHRRVGGVRARGDRGDRDRAGVERRRAGRRPRPPPVGSAVRRSGGRPATDLAGEAGAVDRLAGRERRRIAGREGLGRGLLDQPIAGDRLLAAELGDRSRPARPGSSTGSCRAGR